MATEHGIQFTQLLREQMAVRRGFDLIEFVAHSISEQALSNEALSAGDLSLHVHLLRRGLSLIRDLKPPAPPDYGDGLSGLLAEVDASIEAVLESLFLFRKEWEEGYAYELEAQCNVLQLASKAVVKHVENIGFQ